jgi:hypothetical protein
MKLLVILIPLVSMSFFVMFFTNNSTSEHYKFKDIGSFSLYKSIVAFKEEYPQYKVFDVLISGKKEEIGISSCEGSYCYFAFYFEDLDIIAYCEMFNYYEPTLFFRSVKIKNKGGFYKEKYINTVDLSWCENQKIKTKLEVEVLNKLGNWKSNSIFYSFASYLFSLMRENWIWFFILWVIALVYRICVPRLAP